MTLKKSWKLAYPLAVGRAQRQLALGDDMALVDAHEEARLRLRRRHEDEHFPVRGDKQPRISRRYAGFQISDGDGEAAAREWGLALPGEVSRLLPRRNPSGVDPLYKSRGGGFTAGGSWAGLHCYILISAFFCYMGPDLRS
jgi:hypothetical protein